MSRAYLALIERNRGSAVAAVNQAKALGFSTVYQHASITVLMQPKCRAVMLPAGKGVVLGALFRRSGPEGRIRELDPHDSGRLCGNPVVALNTSFWGPFVAFYDLPDGPGIFRAAMGSLACNYVATPDLIAASSDPRILRATKLASGYVDWEGIGEYLYSRDLPAERTALVGVSELLPGTQMKITSRTVEIGEIWSPWQFVTGEAGRNRDPLDERFRRTMLSCTHSLCAEHSSLLIGVSGGLDSSIVAAAIDRRHTLAQGLTITSEGIGGDETRWAQRVCDWLEFPLNTAAHSLDAVDFDRSVAAHRAKPSGRIHELAYHSLVKALANQIEASAFVTGNGGDNVLYYTHSSRPLIDRFLTEGLTSSLWSTARNIGNITGASIPQVLAEAFRVWIRERRSYHWKPDRSFLDQDILAHADRRPLDHAWLRTPKGGVPGKSAHIALLLRMLHHVEGYADEVDLPVINPMTAQPLVELCLGIPTWRTVEGGINRSVARRAFAGFLPPEILRRHSKGGPDGFARSVIRQNIGEVRGRLLDGSLVAHRIADATTLQTALERSVDHPDFPYMRILSLLDTEAWIAGWEQ